jgi:DNA-binding beta-propeller fold protein YncE
VKAARLIAGLCLSVLVAGASAHADEPTQHFEYVVAPGAIYAYDMDHSFSLVKMLPMTTTSGSNIKGLAADPNAAMLYVSYGGDGQLDGFGSLLKYDLVAERLVWSRNYAHGVDSMAISSDGSLLYMPVGEEEKSSFEWKIVDAATGDELGNLLGGRAPHNTVVGASGSRVYLAGREDRYLYARNTVDGSLTSTIGPFIDTIRPFTINGAESLVFTTHTNFLGFQVGRIADGQILFSVAVEGFKPESEFTTPSHGISLSPDEQELYLVDTANAYVHVFNVGDLPDVAPSRVASIKLSRGCGTGWCGRISWLQHSLDGRFVMVGDSGDVIDTRTRRVVTTLAPLRETRKMLEIDWATGRPIAASPREGLGRRIPGQLP